ncbi:MAG: hypothetical protein WGN25_13085 [Candidatus Electrothrix sp. GW3-4]|uniref:hypothetical protein n=1 Tax=Candidatus Electrothrix sp. GW3-4 TaxID=3126740 RepID=UPI0030CF5DD1
MNAAFNASNAAFYSANVPFGVAKTLLPIDNRVCSAVPEKFVPIRSSFFELAEHDFEQLAYVARNFKKKHCNYPFFIFSFLAGKFTMQSDESEIRPLHSFFVAAWFDLNL